MNRPSEELFFKIEPDGRVRMVYSELVDLQGLGQARIQRGSHVEPDSDGRWYADLSPTLGPKLGPFDLRSQALKAEIAWLHEHWLGL
jgi:hypothetical protein